VSAAYVSAMVAGLAVIVSGVMQFLTVRQSRENTKETLAVTRENTKETLAVTRENAVLTAEKTRENTILTLQEARMNSMASIVSADTQKWVDELRADLAEYIALSLKTSTRFKDYMEKDITWPGEHEELVLELEVLSNRITLRLDLENEAQHKLYWSVWHLVHFSHKDPWTDRKLELMENAREVFADRWSTALGPSAE